MHKWAVNDIPLAISEHDTSTKQRAYITWTILNALQEIRQAKQIRDMQRVKALQTFLKDTAQQAHMPDHLAGTIVIPNITIQQKIVITGIIRRVIRKSPLKAYERQALRHRFAYHAPSHTQLSLFSCATQSNNPTILTGNQPP